MSKRIFIKGNVPIRKARVGCNSLIITIPSSKYTEKIQPGTKYNIYIDQDTFNIFLQTSVQPNTNTAEIEELEIRIKNAEKALELTTVPRERTNLLAHIQNLDEQLKILKEKK